MKKTFSVLLALTAILFTISASGCSDFQNNPTGVWKLDHVEMLKDGKFVLNREDYSMVIGMKLVFSKSGTGYIDFKGSKGNNFEYDYSGTDLTMYVEGETTDSEKVGVEYHISEDGSYIYRDMPFEQDDVYTQTTGNFCDRLIYYRE